MAFIITKSEDRFLDAVSDPSLWVKNNPDYAGMFDRIADHRPGHVEKGTSLKSPEWRKVASMPSTLLDVLKQMSPDGTHLDKKKFYGWLNRNPAYKAREQDMGGDTFWGA